MTEDTCGGAIAPLVKFSARCDYDYETFLADKNTTSTWNPHVLGLVNITDITAPFQVGITKKTTTAVDNSSEEFMKAYTAWKTLLISTDKSPVANIAPPTQKTLNNAPGVAKMPQECAEMVKEHQRNVMRFVWRRLFTRGEGGCVIAHGMGLGKTMDAVVLMATFIKTYKEHKQIAKTLIMVPRIVTAGVLKEVGKFKTVYKTYEKANPITKAPENSRTTTKANSTAGRTGKAQAKHISHTNAKSSTDIAAVHDSDHADESDLIMVYKLLGNFTSNIAMSSYYEIVSRWHQTGGVLLIDDSPSMSKKYAQSATGYEPVEPSAIMAKHKFVKYQMISDIPTSALKTPKNIELKVDEWCGVITEITQNDDHTKSFDITVKCEGGGDKHINLTHEQYLSPPSLHEIIHEENEWNDVWTTRFYKTRNMNGTTALVEDFHAFTRIEHCPESRARQRAHQQTSPTYTHHKFQPALVIVDEAHVHLGHKTQSSRALRTRASWCKSLNISPMKSNEEPMFFFETTKRVMMTGTPIPNARTELWHLMLITRGREGFPRQGCSQLQCDTANAFAKLFGKARSDDRLLEKARVAVLRHYFMIDFVDYKCQTEVLKYDLPTRSEFIINVRMNQRQVHMQRQLFMMPKKGGIIQKFDAQNIWTHPNFENHWGSNIPAHLELYRPTNKTKQTPATADYKDDEYVKQKKAPHYRIQFTCGQQVRYEMIQMPEETDEDPRIEWLGPYNPEVREEGLILDGIGRRWERTPSDKLPTIGLQWDFFNTPTEEQKKNLIDITHNVNLATAIQTGTKQSTTNASSTTVFTMSRQTLNGLGLDLIAHNTYIKVGGRHFKPAEVQDQPKHQKIITNTELARRLQEKDPTFTDEEVKDFNLGDLSYETYIIVNELYFNPAPTGPLDKWNVIRDEAHHDTIVNRFCKTKPTEYCVGDYVLVRERRPRPYVWSLGTVYFADPGGPWPEKDKPEKGKPQNGKPEKGKQEKVKPAEPCMYIRYKCLDKALSFDDAEVNSLEIHNNACDIIEGLTSEYEKHKNGDHMLYVGNINDLDDNVDDIYAVVLSDDVALKTSQTAFARLKEGTITCSDGDCVLMRDPNDNNDYVWYKARVVECLEDTVSTTLSTKQ